jgi:hypothetical protein
MSARPTIGALLGALTLAAASVALAQDRPPATVDPKACTPDERLLPDAQGAKRPSTTGEDLSNKLARTDGVICPPEVDPGIKAPTPDAGKTPVIPPPGSPGGDPSVRPK